MKRTKVKLRTLEMRIRRALMFTDRKMIKPTTIKQAKAWGFYSLWRNGKLEQGNLTAEEIGRRFGLLKDGEEVIE